MLKTAQAKLSKGHGEFSKERVVSTTLTIIMFTKKITPKERQMYAAFMDFGKTHLKAHRETMWGCVLGIWKRRNAAELGKSIS